MKILVPTDFSECADFALNAACQFALIMDSDITLFHVADLPDEFGAKSSDDSLAERVQERMKNNIDELMSQREAMAGSVGVKLHKESCFGSFTMIRNSSLILSLWDHTELPVNKSGLLGLTLRSW
jgi:nucleotide-binding universal stress UspA family protein